MPYMKDMEVSTKQNITPDTRTVEAFLEQLNNEDYLSKNRQQCLNSLKSFKRYALQVGLSPQQLLVTCKLSASRKIGLAVRTQLVSCLIPRENVPEDIACLIISKICEDLKDVKIKCLLLRWLIIVYDLLTSKTKLHCLYGILFHYIGSDILCPSICQLLFLLTRKNEVTHYRISKLLELQKRVGNVPHICGLLSVYRMYQPSLISMSGNFKTFFKKQDRAWEQSILRMQQRHGINMFSEGINPMIPMPKVERKLMHQPLVTMAHNDTQNMQPLADHLLGKVPIYQITSFQELLDHFGQLDLDCQAFTLLSSTTFRHLVAIACDRTMPLRLSFWLHHCLNEELMLTGGESKRGIELLHIILQLSDLIQECLPVCEAFLFRYLCTWNGKDYCSYILKLLTRIRIFPYSVLHDLVLSPLHKLFVFSSNVYLKCSIINTMTEMLCNYLSLETSKHEVLSKLSALDASDITEQFRHTLYPHNADQLDPEVIIRKLIVFVGELCAEGLRLEPNNLLLIHYALQFHLQVSSTFEIHAKPIVVAPTLSLVSAALFTLSSPCISVLLEILCNHRIALTKLKEEGSLTLAYQEEIDLLNQYFVDVYDSIWRRRAFKSGNDNSIFYKNLDSGDMDEMLSHTAFLSRRMFCLDRHPAFALTTRQYIETFDLPLESIFNAKFVLEENYAEFLKSRGLHKVLNFIIALRSPSN
ncbi:centromere protein I-like [Clavelina lepadiformis]|uniref:centromere protein I-like n=1 Tax=Clavelina lepadiformis TaxID=159417 RepID=UPI004041B525